MAARGKEGCGEWWKREEIKNYKLVAEKQSQECKVYDWLVTILYTWN